MNSADIKKIKNYMDSLTKKLCIERTREGYSKRKQIFDKFDKNQNGFLSYLEALQGIKEVLGLVEISECKPVVYRAFLASKDSQKNKYKLSSEFIELNEFRYFLCYLRQYYQYYQMFSLINADGNISINWNEFLSGLPLLEEWGVKVNDPHRVFDEIDLDHGKTIKFDEFCSWAIKTHLILEGDDFYDECLRNLK